jgi:hypothetical protein
MKKAADTKAGFLNGCMRFIPGTFKKTPLIFQREYNVRKGAICLSIHGKETIGPDISNSIPLDAGFGCRGIGEYYSNSFIPATSITLW